MCIREAVLDSEGILVGLAEVIAPLGSATLGTSHRAFVNVASCCGDEQLFRDRVNAAMEDYGLYLFHLDDVSPASARLARKEPKSELLALIRNVESNGRVSFGTFFAFPVADDGDDTAG